jgi:hypothetical protein
MTAQHAPHTPLSPTERWRWVLSLPKTTDGWFAVGLAASALVLTVFFPLSEVFGWTFLRQEVAEGGSSDQYPILILAWILSAVLGGVFGLIAVLRSQEERSLLVWFAQVPAALFFLLLVTAFEQDGPWVRGPVSVLVWAVIAFGIVYLRQGRSS